MQTPARQQQALREAVGKIDAAVYNALVEMRKSLDAQHDTAVEKLSAEVLAADDELREHLRYVLADGTRGRVVGAVLLGVGILLEIAGAIVGTVH